MVKKFITIARCQAGATAIEYGLIVALVALAAIAAMSSLGGGSGGLWGGLVNDIVQ